MANISTLTVSLVADTAKFSNGLKKGKKSAGAFAKAAKASAKAAALAFAGAAVAIGGLVVQSLKLVDAQRKSARTLGTSQAIYSGLALAAGIAGLETAGFTKALKRQQKSIADAGDGLQTQKRAFDRLGLSIESLLKLPVEQQFITITTALGKVENATLKVAIASDVYGAKNADLINIIDLGADGIAKYIRKAKELGAALTDNQTKKVEDANDAWLIFKTSITGLGNQLASSLAPAISIAAEQLTTFVVGITDGIPAFTAWATSILGVERALNSLTIAELSAELDQINDVMSDMVDRRDRLEAQTRNPAIVAEFGTAFQNSEIKKLNEELIRLAERFNEATAARTALRESGEVATGGDPIIDSEGSELGSSFTARARSSLDGVNAALAESESLFAEWERQAQTAFDNSRSPVEAFNIAVEKIRANPFIDADLQERAINDAIERLHTGLEEITNDVVDQTDTMSEFTIQAFRNMETALSDALFKPWDEGLDGMVKALQTALQKMLSDLIASKILNFIQGIFTGGIGSGTTSVPSRAVGGPVARGQSVRVHEGEIFTPGASGRIGKMGSVSVTQENHFGGGDAITVAVLIPILEENNRMMKAQLLDEFDRGAFA